MPTLYVENVPDDFYEALRAQARLHGTSISAEVLKLLSAAVPTAAQLARRKEIVDRIGKLRLRPTPTGANYLATEELLREDRAR